MHKLTIPQSGRVFIAFPVSLFLLASIELIQACAVALKRKDSLREIKQYLFYLSHSSLSSK